MHFTNINIVLQQQTTTIRNSSRCRTAKWKIILPKMFFPFQFCISCRFSSLFRRFFLFALFCFLFRLFYLSVKFARTKTWNNFPTFFLLFENVRSTQFKSNKPQRKWSQRHYQSPHRKPFQLVMVKTTFFSESKIKIKITAQNLRQFM